MPTEFVTQFMLGKADITGFFPGTDAPPSISYVRFYWCMRPVRSNQLVSCSRFMGGSYAETSALFSGSPIEQPTIVSNVMNMYFRHDMDTGEYHLMVFPDSYYLPAGFALLYQWFQ